MRTAQWIKKLGGHAGELYVSAELSKRGIPNALLPENFSGDDILAGQKDGSRMCFIQVKACHPDRASSFLLRETEEEWAAAPENQFVVFVWLGSPRNNEPPQYWVAPKREVGQACINHAAHGTENFERRFGLDDLNSQWKNAWSVITSYVEPAQDGVVQD